MGLGGSALGTILTDSLNHWLLLGVVMAIGGVVNLFVPYMGHVAPLCIVLGIGRAASAFFDSGKVIFYLFIRNLT